MYKKKNLAKLGHTSSIIFPLAKSAVWKSGSRRYGPPLDLTVLFKSSAPVIAMATQFTQERTEQISCLSNKDNA